MAARMDRRTARTRTALIEAFNHLALGQRKNISVADIVALANVGRSTFYEHYKSADDIHLQAMARPFALLADAAAGLGDEERLTSLLRHFWDNRQLARSSFMGRMHDKVTRLLAGMIEDRLRDEADALAIPLRLAAMQLAEAALAPIRGWVTAEASCTAEALAGAICRCGRALRRGLEKEDSPLPFGGELGSVMPPA
jgi:AcrR family transcriptional regulator